MITDVLDDYEVDDGELVELPELESTHRELIDGSIREQVQNPFDSTVNFVDEYFIELDRQISNSEENPDLKSQIITDGIKFCQEVIGLIDIKYGLDINDEALEEMNLEDIRALCYSLYDFFVVHYPKNIKKFFIKYILQNIDDISEALSTLRNKNDVVSVSLRSKLTDERAANILANLRSVISYIDSLDLNGLDVLGYFNPERYDVYVLSQAINDMVVGENFVPAFFRVLTNEWEDENYTEVYSSIESGLIKKFKKRDIE